LTRLLRGQQVLACYIVYVVVVLAVFAFFRR